MNIVIRNYQADDSEKLFDLFVQTIRNINSKDYSPAEISAWIGEKDLGKWDRSFKEHYTAVATVGQTVVGFGDIARDGYLDRLYVHHNFQRLGIGTRLCDLLEQHFEITEVSTYASITARPFFQARGYTVVQENYVRRGQVKLKNYFMIKRMKISE